jgi:hypothetical protein
LGIGLGGNTTTLPYPLTFTGSGGVGVLSFDNGNIIEARNSVGVYESFLYPRWTDDATYMNYGGGGLNIRNSQSVSTMFLTNTNAVVIGATSTTARRLELGGANTSNTTIADYIHSPNWIPTGDASAATWTVMQIQPNAMNGGYSSSFTSLIGMLLQPIHGGIGRAASVTGLATSVRIARLAAAQCTNAYVYTSQINCELAGGAITNSYHLYMNAPTTVGTIVNRYGIYQVGTTEINVFNSAISASRGINVTGGGVTGSFLGTASFAISASYALNGGGGASLGTGSTYPITSSWATNAISTSVTTFSASTDNYISFISGAVTKATIGFGTAASTAFSISSSTIQFTGSVLGIISSSFATTASFALNGGGAGTSLGTGSTYPITSSWATNALTASLAVTTSYQQITSLTTSSSYASSSASSSYISVSNIKIENGFLFIKSSYTGNWFKLDVYDDGVGNFTTELSQSI